MDRKRPDLKYGVRWGGVNAMQVRYDAVRDGGAVKRCDRVLRPLVRPTPTCVAYAGWWWGVLLVYMYIYSYEGRPSTPPSRRRKTVYAATEMAKMSILSFLAVALAMTGSVLGACGGKGVVSCEATIPPCLVSEKASPSCRAVWV